MPTPTFKTEDATPPTAVREALRTLSSIDRSRLRTLAKIRVRGLPSLTWEDLLNEALSRILSGARAWPSDVPIVAFVAEVMRSVAGDEWRRLSRSVELAEGDIGVDCFESKSLENLAVGGPNPEHVVLARVELRKIVALFENNTHLLSILEAIAEGQSPGDTQDALGVSPTRYASSLRKIRRILKRHFTD